MSGGALLLQNRERNRTRSLSLPLFRRCCCCFSLKTAFCFLVLFLKTQFQLLFYQIFISVTSSTMSMFPHFNYAPQDIQLTDLNTALTNFSFSEFTGFDISAVSSNQFFETQQFTNPNDSGCFFSSISSSNVSNHFLLDRSPYEQDITELLPLVPSLELQSSQVKKEEITTSGSFFYSNSQVINNEFKYDNDKENESACANVNIRSQSVSLSSEEYFKMVDEYATTLLPIVAQFQEYLDDHLEKFTQEEIIDKLQALLAAFENKKPDKASRRTVCKKKEKPQLAKNSQFYNLRSRSMQFIASQNEMEQIGKALRKSNKTYKEVITSRSPTLVSFKKSVGLLCDTKMKFKEVTVENKIALCFLIRVILVNLQAGKTNTVRDIYYRNMKIFKKDSHLAELICDICATLSVSRIDLNILSTPKGAFYGDLAYVDQVTGVSVVGNSVRGGQMIPEWAHRLQVTACNAKFILVIEKYATFFQLLSDNVPETLQCIMITGCGYPDVRTRTFLQRLWLTVKLPVMGLVDGDAYGVDILCNYRYGSVKMAFENLHMTVPEIKWLGITPEDIAEFKLQGTYFKDSEMARFESVKKRAYMLDGNPWLGQIERLQKQGVKVEIQALCDYAPDFLAKMYLPYKIRFGKWI